MSVAGLVAGVTAFLRLRRALARARADGAQSRPTLMTIAPLPIGKSLETLRHDALTKALVTLDSMRIAGIPPPDWLAALFSPTAQTVSELLPNAPEWAIEEAVKVAEDAWATVARDNPYGFTTAETYYLHAVNGDGAVRRRWVRVARTLADSVFDFIAAHPQALGLELRAQTIVAALAGQMSEIIGDDADINESDDEEFGERAFRAFLEATLATAVERPELLAEEAHLQALASGILRPLHAEVKAHPERRWIALDSLQTLLRGPVAHGALRAVREHQEAFLKGDFANDKVLGAVTQVILGEFASIDAQSFNVRKAFTPQGAMVVYRAALRVAQERPELFIDGQGGPTDRARTFLSGVAGVLQGAPFPYNAQSGLGPQVAVVALDVAQAYVARRMVEDTGTSDWSRAGMDAASQIIAAVFGGLREGLAGPGGPRNPLAQVFSRNMAAEVLQVIALHVAERPGMITGRDGSTETRGVAAAFAAMVAQDQSGLLRAQDWRGLLGKLLDLVAQNPGALIGVNPEDDPSSFVSVRLVGKLLQHASAELAQPAAAGRVRLMGARLSTMIEVTLAAAANNVIGALRDPEKERLHFKAFEDFLARLSALAAGEDVTLRMSAADLQHVYQWFIALVLDHGPDAVITDDDIRLVIRGAQSEVAALRPVAGAPAAAAPGAAVEEEDDGPGLDTRPEAPTPDDESAAEPPSPAPETEP